jgi:hypothetical protein
MPNPPLPSLTIRAVKATPVEVPLNFVLGTSQGALRRVPLLLIDLETEEGVTGRSYPFCYRALPPQRPGNGMVWDDDAVKHYRLR